MPINAGPFGAFFVRVDTDTGIYGLGESGMTRTGQAVGKAVEHLAELVIGEDPLSTERLWQHMFRRNFFPAQGVYSCAISAIDIALWDIKGKALGVPVYKLLGGPVRDKVVCYPHCQGNSTDKLIENCVEHVERGWKFVRWGQPETGGTLEVRETGILDPMKSIEVGEEQMARVREAVGPDIQIAFDVHTRLDTHHVVNFCRRVEKYNPFFIEDPPPRREPRQLPHARPSRERAHSRGRAVVEQVAVPRGHRGGAYQLRPDRSLQRRRHYGGAQDHPLGGDALHRHRSATTPSAP